MFEVEWLPVALNELTEVWLAADGPGRQSITAAVRQIDDLLERVPLETGEDREETFRIHFQAPLVVIFQVFQVERRVHVMRIGPMARPRP